VGGIFKLDYLAKETLFPAGERVSHHMIVRQRVTAFLTAFSSEVTPKISLPYSPTRPPDAPELDDSKSRRAE